MTHVHKWNFLLEVLQDYKHLYTTHHSPVVYKYLTPAVFHISQDPAVGHQNWTTSLPWQKLVGLYGHVSVAEWKAICCSMTIIYHNLFSFWGNPNPDLTHAVLATRNWKRYTSELYHFIFGMHLPSCLVLRFSPEFSFGKEHHTANSKVHLCTDS